MLRRKIIFRRFLLIGLICLVVGNFIGLHDLLHSMFIPTTRKIATPTTLSETARRSAALKYEPDDFPVPDVRDGLFLDISPVFFEPEVKEDFPTSDEDPKIPHIIHQTYKTELIPEASAALVKSFVKFNPNWTYFFWTDKTARKFLEDKYTFFLPIWDSYKENVHRADALRYFVLYEYGGLYADIDFECLRPLDRVTKKYPAIFPLEPFEHSVLAQDRSYMINNAIMMSRPHHRFLKYVIDKLPISVNKKPYIKVAGPWFLTDRFLEYHNISKSEEDKIEYKNSSEPYIFTGRQKFHEDDKVYVPNTHYFMNTLADNFALASARSFCELWLKGEKSKCLINAISFWCRLPYTVDKMACNELRRRDLRHTKKEFEFTYTKHHWFATYLTTRVQLDKTVDIRTIVPNLRMYVSDKE